MDKSLLNRLEKLEQRTVELTDASQLSRQELMKIISDDLGYEPTIEEVIRLALEDSDADEVRKE